MHTGTLVMCLSEGLRADSTACRVPSVSVRRADWHDLLGYVTLVYPTLELRRERDTPL